MQFKLWKCKKMHLKAEKYKNHMIEKDAHRHRIMQNIYLDLQILLGIMIDWIGLNFNIGFHINHNPPPNVAFFNMKDKMTKVFFLLVSSVFPRLCALT